MLDTLTVPVERVLCFGPFRLAPAARLLMEGAEQVPLGSRALEALIVLLERPGELVSKETLTERIWPSTVVVEANLTVQMHALRRALRDGRDGNRYILNVPGRGYRFVAPVIVAGEPRYPAPPTSAESFRSNFAASIMRLLDVTGSDTDVLRLLADVDAGLAPDPAEAPMRNDAPHLGLDERAVAAMFLERGIQALQLARTLIAAGIPRMEVSSPATRATYAPIRASRKNQIACDPNRELPAVR